MSYEERIGNHLDAILRGAYEVGDNDGRAGIANQRQIAREADAEILALRERLAAAERERDEAQAAAVRWGVRKREAEAARAVMRTVVETAVASQSWSGDDTREDRWPAFYRAARAALASDHPGADLLARATAAEAVVEAARELTDRHAPIVDDDIESDWFALKDFIATYDARVQANKQESA